jgi:EmrB/QacA subfamily drug resistance transporter
VWKSSVTVRPTMEALVLVRYHSPAGRWVLLVTVLGSGLVALDATVVNIALPAIGQDFGASLTSLQWIVNAYSLTLAGLLLLGGSLGDRYGRRRLVVFGILWFAVASLICALAPNSSSLIGARALQGIGAALLTPGSLAIIETTFHPEDRSVAIGAWSGLGGVMIAIGPVVGGYLTTAMSWRLIFFINLPFAALAAWAAMKHLPESRHETAAVQLDYVGAVLAALGLGGVIFALTVGPDGWGTPIVIATGVGGIIALVSFVLVERSSRHPLLPLEIFRSRQLTAANAITFLIYGALGGALFLLPIQLQRVVGLSALESGSALIPMTILLLVLSPLAGRFAQRTGPRLPMTVGPFVAAVGLALLVRVGSSGGYWLTILPGVVVFGLGLSITVAPLTATVLAAAGPERAGIASAINNEVARAAGLIAVATLPLVAGITGRAALDPQILSVGFRMAMWIAATLVAAGGVLSYLMIQDVPAAAGGSITSALDPASHRCCPLDAPPLRRMQRRD